MALDYTCDLGHALAQRRTRANVDLDLTLYTSPMATPIRILPGSKGSFDEYLLHIRDDMIAAPTPDTWQPYSIHIGIAFHMGYLFHRAWWDLGVAHFACRNCSLALMAHASDGRCLYEPTFFAGWYGLTSFDFETGRQVIARVLYFRKEDRRD